MSDAVVILGMHRSGTSALAKTLSALGLDFGEESELLPADKFNPEGYFEVGRLMAFNNSLMFHFGMSWHTARALPESWQEHPYSERLVVRASQLLTEVFGGRDLWGWKDPRTTLLVPFYRKALDGMGARSRFLITTRNPIDVANSLERRNAMPCERGLGLWLHYTLASLYHTIGTDRHAVLYETLVEDPVAALLPVAEWAGLPTRTRDDLSRIANETIKPELRHSARTFEEVDALKPSIVGEAYRLFARAATDHESFRRGCFDAEIVDLYHEWSSYQDALTAKAMWEGVATCRHGVTELHSPLNLDYRWRGLEFKDVPGATTLSLQLCPVPSMVFVRKINFVESGASQEPAKLHAGGKGVLAPVAGGVVKLLTFGAGTHLRVTSPPGSKWTLQMEYLGSLGLEGGSEAATTLLSQYMQLSESLRQARDGLQRAKAEIRRIWTS